MSKTHDPRAVKAGRTDEASNLFKVIHLSLAEFSGPTRLV